MTEKPTEKIRKRPFLLSVICIALFVYTGVLSLIFLLALVFNGWMHETVNGFFPEQEIDPMQILLIGSAGFFLNGLAFFAVLSMWRLKRYGLYLFVLSSFLVFLVPYFLGYGNAQSLLIIGVFNLLLFLFYSKFN